MTLQTPEKLLDRPLPSLAQWLGDGERAEGFEEWVRDTVFTERFAANEDEAAALRILRTMAIACMEACRLETEKHDRPTIDTVRMLARVTGSAVMAPILSILDDNKKPPLRKIVRMFTEDFGHGAMLMARGAERGNRP